jgi:hypothetical protein
MPATQKMQRYRCFKEVSAFKIYDVSKTIPHLDLGVLICGDGNQVEVDDAWMKKHSPKYDTAPLSSLLGGYVVIYDDGYMSFSPAEAFEAGYARI